MISEMDIGDRRINKGRRRFTTLRRSGTTGTNEGSGDATSAEAVEECLGFGTWGADLSGAMLRPPTDRAASGCGPRPV
jgi:hypothetical protein